jgi:hypothetical protein
VCLAQTAAEDSSVSQDDTRQASGGIHEEAPIYGASNYVLASPASSSVSDLLNLCSMLSTLHAFLKLTYVRNHLLVQQVSPIKEGNRAKASNLVLSREAKAPLSRRIASSITGNAELPNSLQMCWGPHPCMHA